MNKILLVYSGILSCLLGIKIYLVGKHRSYHGGGIEINFGDFKYVIGLSLILFGLALLYAAYREFKNPPKHHSATKCPKCKEVFEYKDTLEGKCPHCKDVDTIDVKEYYKKYPEELKEETK